MDMTKLNKTQYNEYFDILQVFSCFLVIMTHIFGNLLNGDTGFSKTYVVMWVIWKLSIIAVPIFVMMSGAKFLAKKVSMRKYIFNLSRIYISWMVIYFIIFLCLSMYHGWIDSLSIITLFKRIQNLPDYAYHLWYLPMLIALYFLKPVLELIIDRLGYFIKLNLAILFIAALVSINSSLNLFYISSNIYIESIKLFPIMPLYFILGYYLSIKDIKYKYIISILSVTIVTIVMLANILFQQKYELAYHRELFGFRDSIVCVLLVTAIFITLKEHYCKFPNWMKRAMKHLSKNTLSIYLVHVIYVNIIILTRSRFGEINTLVFCIFASVAVFVMSYITSCILRKIPIISKIV